MLHFREPERVDPVTANPILPDEIYAGFTAVFAGDRSTEIQARLEAGRAQRIKLPDLFLCVFHWKRHVAV